jgi:hypothetical protein
MALPKFSFNVKENQPRRAADAGDAASLAARAWRTRRAARTDFCPLIFAVQKLDGSLRILRIDFRFVIRTVEC